MRTSVIRDACALVQWIAREFPEEFAKSGNSQGKSLSGGNGIKYFKADAVPKLIIGGNKLM